jgi:hypothetical protein
MVLWLSDEAVDNVNVASLSPVGKVLPAGRGPS